MAEGKFRQDLFYRINVMRINSPALAEHAEDIPQIATHYLQHYSRMFLKPMHAITAEAMTMLQNYYLAGQCAPSSRIRFSAQSSWRRARRSGPKTCR